MVKFTDLLIGVILFSGFLAFAFYASGTLGQDYNSDDFQTYLDLQQDYNYTGIGTSNESLIRDQNIITRGAKIAGDAGAALLNGGVQAVKFIPDGIALTSIVIDRIVTDMGIPQVEIVATIIKSIISVVIIVMVVGMFMRFKAET